MPCTCALGQWTVVALRQHSQAKDKVLRNSIRCGHMMAHCGRLWLWLAGSRFLTRHLRGRMVPGTLELKHDATDAKKCITCFHHLCRP